MERGIKNQFSIRNQRPKGYFKIFKVTVITIICFWLLYQIRKSLNNKKDERPVLQGKVDEALGLLRNFDKELDSNIFGRKGNAGRSKEEAFSENDQLDSEGKNIGEYSAGDDEIDGFVDAGSVFSQKRNKNEKVEVVDKGKRAEDYELGIVVQKQNDRKREESYELVHLNQKAQTNYVGKKHKEEDPKENWKSIESLKTTNDNVKQEQDEETSSSMEKEEGSVKKEPIIDEVQGFDDVTGVSQDGNDLFLTGSRDDFSSNFRRELVSNDSVDQGNIDDQNSENEGKGSNKEEEISDSDVEITKTKSSVQDSKIETADAYTKVESN